LLSLLLAVNDPPSFTPGERVVTVPADSDTYNKSWASNISPGPGEDQPVLMSINCSGDVTRLFSDGPSITADGVLSFTPKKFASGAMECTVTLKDGEEGSSVTEPLTIVVTDGELLAVTS
jgi:hypothetical protein